MPQGLQRASVLLTRHPAVFALAVALIAAVSVAALGDFSGIADAGVVAEFDVEPMEGGAAYDGPNNVDGD